MATDSSDHQSIFESPELDKYKVGPMPPLPTLSKRPNPPGFYIFADGHITRVSGFVNAMLLGVIERKGFARRIPYGIEVRTDAQKLWFLVDKI